MKTERREAGVLLHPVSLPSRFGVGDIGNNAFIFVDKLRKSKIGLWQILPLGPTGFGDSPYAARSAFAGNEILISLEKLYEDGYLEMTDILKAEFVSQRVDYENAKKVKLPLLRKAAEAFLRKPSKEYKAFCKEKAWWLDDYALFQVLCEKFNDSRWFSIWPEELRKRDEKAVAKATRQYADEVSLYKVYQYFFYKQWAELKEYANRNGVRIIGDIPIFVAPDSADAWTNTKLLKFDEECHQEASSGVPPDAFSATGQLWGNPLYRWSEHEKTGFEWWVNRVRETLGLCDIIRIDHFRGLEACWEVPAGETTAMNGKWVKAPGQKLLDALKKALGELPIIAEDLGVITPAVEKLRDKNGLPGMKILQFAFGFSDGKFDTSNAYLPHNVWHHSVIYTGTHDNNTTLGWYRSLDDGTRDFVRRYLETGDDDVVYKLIRAALMTPAVYAIIPYQDVLCLGEEARMNVPATCGSSNWSWKMSEKELTDDNFTRFAYYVELYGRDSKVAAADEHNTL